MICKGTICCCCCCFATPWNVAHQAPLFMGFPRQEYWSGLPSPSPVDLCDPVIKPSSPALAESSLPLTTSSVQSLSHVWLFVTPWIAARQASLSITNSWSSPSYLQLSLVSGQTTGREHSHAHQQKIGLKIYWAWPTHWSKTWFFPQSVSPIRKLS